MNSVALLSAFAFALCNCEPLGLEEKLNDLVRLAEQLESRASSNDATISDLRSQVHGLKASGRRLNATSEADESTPSPPTPSPPTPAIIEPTTLTASDASTTISADDIIVCLDHIWLIMCGILVMFMQAGFAMLEAGTCRAKNVQSILLKNVMDVCVGTIGWWIFGWAFAYGGPADDDGFLANGFIGTEAFGGSGFSEADADTGIQTGGVPAGSVGPTSQVNWFFQWAFCAAAATIVSGGVAERIDFPAYVIFSFLMTSFVYPVVVAWTWGYGWIAAINDVGYMDFAGSGVVHLTGGIGALVGAAIVGPRAGRFDAKRIDEFAPHSLPLCVFGTFILWFGWYGFNCGSTLSMHSASTGAMAAQVAMNTTIAAATGGLVVLVLRLGITFKETGAMKYDLNGMCAGVLAGLVSITAPCGNVECGSAFFIAIIGAHIFQAASTGLKKIGIDDPIDAFAVHGAAGVWGVLAAALFDWGVGMDYAHGWSGWNCYADDDGNCRSGAWGQTFVANIVEIIAIIAWTSFFTTAILLPMRLAGILRVSDEKQAEGMDAKHSPSKAYSLDEDVPFSPKAVEPEPPAPAPAAPAAEEAAPAAPAVDGPPKKDGEQVV